jgi:serine O-acetyltransferase
MILILLLVKACGGIWKVKEICCRGRTRISRWLAGQLWGLWMRANGSFIEAETAFANPPCFPHGIRGIFISGDARIGKNCVIFQQVTIGSNYLPNSKKMGAPTIGNNCLIGAGATIVGGVKVGDACRIGAGCVVFEDIPANSVVVLPAPRIIQRKEILSNCYYAHKEDGWYCFGNGTWTKESDESVLASLESARRG